MFWFKTIRDLKLRLTNLEVKTRQRETKEACAKGKHEWEMHNTNHTPPYVRCVHCYKEPEKPNG